MLLYISLKPCTPSEAVMDPFLFYVRRIKRCRLTAASKWRGAETKSSHFLASFSCGTSSFMPIINYIGHSRWRKKMSLVSTSNDPNIWTPTCKIESVASNVIHHLSYLLLSNLNKTWWMIGGEKVVIGVVICPLGLNIGVLMSSAEGAVGTHSLHLELISDPTH